MAEERRLLYVGITRAMHRLYLVRAFRRRLFGTSAVGEPSRFLFDIPTDLVEGDPIGGQTPAEALYARQTTWDRSAAPTPEARFRAGMRVSHAKFGEGIVLESHVDHDDEEVTVQFETAGTKRLVASLARLEALEG